MSLTLVAVPIGNLGDITLRALESFRNADLFIGEERKPMFRLLKELGIPTPEKFELLNEHSDSKEIKRIAELCRDQNAVLLTDCGTPGFSDPGAELVSECRKLGVSVTSNPGPSSLTCFLSLCGQRITEFDFLGFPPRDSADRSSYFKKISQLKKPAILMDTPYRLQRTLQDCAQWLPDKTMVLGMDLTRENETFYTGSSLQVSKQCQDNKREFMILLY